MKVTDVDSHEGMISIFFLKILLYFLHFTLPLVFLVRSWLTFIQFIQISKALSNTSGKKVLRLSW